MRPMTEKEIIAFVSSLDDVVATTASAESGAPESAWGDSFFCYDPEGSEANQRFPFATLVCSDYPGWDSYSELDRDGVFRLNVAVGRTAYERLLGHSPAEHGQHSDAYDYAEVDVLLPHPVYAGQGWVSIVNPGPRTTELAQRLLVEAHDLAQGRWRRRRGRD
jgi:Family of unknown function (DUF6194)